MSTPAAFTFCLVLGLVIAPRDAPREALSEDEATLRYTYQVHGETIKLRLDRERVAIHARG